MFPKSRYHQMRARHAARIPFAAALILGALVLPLSSASAYSFRVKAACARDYYAHCSAYSLESQEVRQCMRAVGRGLSTRCIDALVADGEVSKAEVARRSASLR